MLTCLNGPEKEGDATMDGLNCSPAGKGSAMDTEEEEAVDLDLPLGAEAIGHNPAGAADQDDLEEAEEAMLGVTSGTAGRWVFTT